MDGAVCLVLVPYMAGDDRHSASRGPERLLSAGVAERLAGRGRVRVERIEREGPFRDTGSASLSVNRRLAASIRAAMAAGEFPFVLAGSCDAALGVLAGIGPARCGAIWFDAHGDFNTPESTLTGFFPGMSLAIATGHCYRKLWTSLGQATPLAEDTVLMIGVRDLDAEEAERLASSGIDVVHWSDGEPGADVTAALDRLAGRVEDIYLHIDLDALDPSVASAIVDHPVPGGLSLGQLEMVLRGVVERFRVRAAAVTTYDPTLDPDERTLRVVLRIAELIAGADARPPRHDPDSMSNSR